MNEPDVLPRLRRLLLAMLSIGAVGTGAELLLLGHFEGTAQLIPLGLLAIAVVVVVWHAAAPRAATVRALQATMTLLVFAGGLGVGLHYQGNTEFELEMYPTMRGLELVQKTLTGATPVLAPGSMTLLGLIGLAHAYRHPSLTGE